MGEGCEAAFCGLMSVHSNSKAFWASFILGMHVSASLLLHSSSLEQGQVSVFASVAHGTDQLGILGVQAGEVCDQLVIVCKSFPAQGSFNSSSEATCCIMTVLSPSKVTSTSMSFFKGPMRLTAEKP